MGFNGTRKDLVSAHRSEDKMISLCATATTTTLLNGNVLWKVNIHKIFKVSDDIVMFTES